MLLLLELHGGPFVTEFSLSLHEGAVYIFQLASATGNLASVNTVAWLKQGFEVLLGLDVHGHRVVPLDDICPPCLKGSFFSLVIRLRASQVNPGNLASKFIEALGQFEELVKLLIHPSITGALLEQASVSWVHGSEQFLHLPLRGLVFQFGLVSLCKGRFHCRVLLRLLPLSRRRRRRRLRRRRLGLRLGRCFGLSLGRRLGLRRCLRLGRCFGLSLGRCLGLSLGRRLGLSLGRRLGLRRRLLALFVHDKVFQ